MANLSRVRSRKRDKGDICRLIAATKSNTDYQPLNLCVRDESSVPIPLDQSIKLSLPPSTSSSSAVLRRRKKRSAIFLPPEKLAVNDVCICKFKFVSGMQPRLQEKKVLSIDSGGNFRFFPELGATQQASNSVAPSTSHTHNQQAAGTIASSTAGPKPLPDLLPIKAVCPSWSIPPKTDSTAVRSAVPVTSQTSTKKLSRRQKMEQSFGEKGFLIQTQHVPATEGSAFCKFRQLKKFTRYLYRSWRHYLPEEEATATSTTKSEK